MGKHRVYTEEILREAVASSVSYAGVLRFLGIRQAGGSQAHISRLCTRFGVDTSHFTGQGHNQGVKSPHRLTPEELFSQTTHVGGGRIKGVKLKRALLESGVEEICEKCGVGPIWNGELLTLQVDHRDGDWENNSKSNLRLLCPNCHSQTATFCRRK